MALIYRMGIHDKRVLVWKHCCETTLSLNTNNPHYAVLNMEDAGQQGIGLINSGLITPEFKERFQLIYNVVKLKHPEITIVGTTGPSPDGEDFNLGWKQEIKGD